MDSKGFTLVELMVIIVIIGILVAISVTRYSEQVNRAHVNSMVTTLRRIIDAQIVYNAANNGYAGCADSEEVEKKLGVQATSEYFTYSVDVGSDSSHFNITAEVVQKIGKIPVGQQVIITDSNTAKLLNPNERVIVDYARSFFNGYPLEN